MLTWLKKKLESWVREIVRDEIRRNDQALAVIAGHVSEIIGRGVGRTLSEEK